MTKKIIETPVVLTELQEPIAMTKEGVELAGVIEDTTTVKPFPYQSPDSPKMLKLQTIVDEENSIRDRVAKLHFDASPVETLQWEEGNGTWKESDLSDSFENPLGKLFAIRLNELEARIDYNDRRIAVLMKDREAYIRLMHGRMNNEVGLQAMINGWENA